MRVALLGVSHWHAKHYYAAVSRLPGRTLVGISDPDTALLARLGAELGTATYTDYRALIDEQQPDFVFIFAPHFAMAEVTAYVIDQGIACMVEKPGGMNSAEIADLEKAAAKKNLHVGTGFNFRVSDFYRQVIALTRDEQVSWASFRFIAGFPSRYTETGNSWMLDPSKAGGGSTINLAVHFFDMFCEFTGSQPTEISALMGNQTWGMPVEDYSSVSLRSERAVCTVETGYSFPSTPSKPYDLLFSVRTRAHYIIGSRSGQIEVYRNADASLQELSTPSLGNAYWYPEFVEQTLSRFERGQAPIADLRSLHRAMQVVDSAYASSRSNGQIKSINH